jgi:hypothetical protein
VTIVINRDATADDREATWTHLLTTWREHRLPTPDNIDAHALTVWLPRNERAQVDAWAAALGLKPAEIGGIRESGPGYYSASPLDYRNPLSVMCWLSGDVADHWSPSDAVESPLSLAARTVVAMLAPDSPDLPVDYGFNPSLPAVMHEEVGGSVDGDLVSKFCACEKVITGSRVEVQALFADHVATAGPVTPPAVTVSPERVAEILATLNAFPDLSNNDTG